MVILSYEFGLIFLVFFIVYWSCYRSITLQNLLLLVFGLGFIASWNTGFLLSIVGVWLVCHLGTWSLSRVGEAWQKKLIVSLSLLALVGHLCFFKYTNFAILQLNETILAGHNLSPLDIVMPLGISFYTFQAISYLVDVYKQKIPPMPPTQLLGFLTFVPTVTAGPIFRAKQAALPWATGQIGEPIVAESAAATQMANTSPPTFSQNLSPISATRRYVVKPYLAMALIIFALFKKIVLAGWLESLWVTPVFASPLQYNGLEVLTAVYAYSLQLFFDFSGYTDLAIALALLLGFRLPENFNRPYLATDIQDFWNRWHITLSTWIRDYVYIPLGGNRGGFWRVQLNLMLAFMVSGIWHGAGWNFLIWGIIHGAALVWLNVLKRYQYRYWLTAHAKPLAIFLTFHYVAFGWIFFRSESFERALQVLRALVNFQDKAFSLSVLPTLLVMLAAWLVYPWLGQARAILAHWLGYVPWWLLPILLSGYIFVLLSLAPEGLPGFIYANF